MADQKQAKVAIIDHGLGNLFSVLHACSHVGLEAVVTEDKAAIQAADAVILPGVGAYKDAMDALRERDLVSLLQDVATSGKPLIGICLGLQLLLTESLEFGRHAGLGLVKGSVVPLPVGVDADGRALKVPQVGWNRMYHPASGPDGAGEPDQWKDTFFAGLHNGEFMYFVHSFYAKPEDPAVALSLTQYGSVEFCSSLQVGNIFATQFHPERSGPKGLQIYKNIADIVRQS